MSINTTSRDNGSAPSTDELSVDRIHKLLSNSRRRLILDVVLERGAVDKSTLTDVVASRELDKPADLLKSQERKRVHISLHQNHLPALQDAGVLERANRQLRPGENAHRVQSFRHDSRSGALDRIRGVLR